MVMTVDTAAAHFAAGLDRLCVILFSGLHQGMFAPWQRSTRQRWYCPNRRREKRSLSGMQESNLLEWLRLCASSSSFHLNRHGLRTVLALARRPIMPQPLDHTHTHGEFRLRYGHPLPFGASHVPGGVNFSIFSANATSCTLGAF